MSPRAEHPSRRRLLAAGVATLAILVGAVLLHKAFSMRDAAVVLSGWAVGLAIVWTVAGVLLTRLGDVSPQPRVARKHVPVVIVATSLGLAIGSVVGAVWLRDAPVVGPAIESAIVTASQQPVLVLAIVTGAAEELFFRIGLHRVVPDRLAIVVATALYTLVTAASGNVALVVMAAVLGLVTSTALRLTGRAIAPIIVHATWTVATVGVLPQLLGAR